MAQKVFYNNSGRVSEISLSPSSVDLGNVTNDAQIAKSIVDAKGDLIVGTADNTVTRLPVGGTEGHVLTVASSATCGLEWAEASSSTTDLAKIFMFLGIGS